MNEHPIEALMKTTMESIKEMVDVNTIVGDPVETPDGTVIVPISRVSFGFASGGGDYTAEKIQERTQERNNIGTDQNNGGNQFPFLGGAGAGVTVQPVAFMVVGNGQMRVMPVDQRANLIDNIINTTPQVISSINSLFNRKQTNQNTDQNTDNNQMNPNTNLNKTPNNTVNVNV